MTTIAKTFTCVSFAAILLTAGCQEPRDDRDYVQTNVVDKSLFEGEWYYTHTIIDNDYESTYAWAYRGSVSFDQTNSVIGTIARIRFVVDEDWLYAYRSYPVVAEADRQPNGDRDVDLFEPMAAWPIESHFDIVRRYNPETGETLNVIEENTQDRPWYEREYMRVDWSGNVMVGAYNFNDLDVFDPLGIVTREAAPSFGQEGAPWPDEWETRFDFTPTDEPGRDSWEWEYWDRYGPEQLYHFTFVTQEIWNPGVYPFLYSWAWPWMLQGSDEIPMSSVLVSVRHSFLRVPDESQYEPLHMPESSWEMFGTWRVEQPTYTWGDLPDDENGLTNFYGQTDALNYWAGRHNIWRRSFQTDGEGRQQPIPLPEREVQPVVYTLTDGFPAWLIQPSFDLIGEWNGTLMETVRVARNEALPERYFPGECSSDAQCIEEHGDEYPYSACNTSNDGEQHRCTRGYNPFLAPDDSMNDFRCHIVDAEDNLPADPGLTLGSFEDPALESQKGWHFVGDECVLVLRNNTCDDPTARTLAAERACRDASDQEACVADLVAHPAPLCDQMGDLRFNFLAHNDQAGVMWGGVSQPLMDPLTGELIQANANGSMVSVEGAMTITGWYFDLVDGEDDEVDELSVMVGEDVRRMMENTQYAIPPVMPAVPPSFSTSEDVIPGALGPGTGLPRLDESIERAWDMRGMEGRTKIFSDRRYDLQGTTLERSLLSGTEGMLSMGFVPDDAMASPSDEMLAEASPFRVGVHRVAAEHEALFNRMRDHNFCFSADQDVTSFVDNSFVNWLNDYEGLTDQQRAIATGRAYFRGMMIHEMGHSVGMRHNFAGSLDYQNYHDQYYHIEDADPLPLADDYDVDEDNLLSYEELGRFNSDLQSARERREAAGVARWHNASVMEYMPRISNDLAPLGRYDRGFTHFVYGNQLEVYTEPPVESRLDGVTRERPWMNRPDRANRGYEQYFLGGEPCRIDRDTRTGRPERFHDEDCPYAVIWVDPETQRDDACAFDEDCPTSMRCTPQHWCISNALPEGQVVGQRCAENPRAGQTEHREDLPGICLGYDDSWQAYRAHVGAPNIAIFPVEYRFCSDDRTQDISWCTTFDEGESFVEVMHHFRDRWERSYPFVNFRRYRRFFDTSAIYTNFSTYASIAKVMSHFYYRYIYENLWEHADGRWVDSIDDHIAGAATGMNFLAEVIAQPDVGSYQFDSETNTYELVSPDLGQGDLDIEPGMGRYMWSAYQTGYHFGITRLERIGAYQDKYLALIALSRRDWGSTLLYDERFWINFYSMFEGEMNQLFGGLILDDARLYGPRVCLEGEENPFAPGTECEHDTIVYQDLWRGSSFTNSEESRGNPYDDVYGRLPAINGGSNELLQTWAVILSLAEFPIFYDPVYEQQLYLFIEGTGESFDIRECDDLCADLEGDELETCIDETDCTVEGEDFVRYFSERFNQSFVAFRVGRGEATAALATDSTPTVDMSFQIVGRANVLQDAIDACEEGTDECVVPAGPARQAAIEEWHRQLERTESFLLTVLDIQSSYGISSWL